MAEEERGSHGLSGDFLTEKKGGLPVWAWIGGAGLLVGVIAVFLKRRGASAANAVQANPFAFGPLSGGGGLGGGGGGGGGGIVTTGPTLTGQTPLQTQILGAFGPSGSLASGEITTQAQLSQYEAYLQGLEAQGISPSQIQNYLTFVPPTNTQVLPTAPPPTQYNNPYPVTPSYGAPFGIFSGSAYYQPGGYPYAYQMPGGGMGLGYTPQPQPIQPYPSVGPGGVVTWITPGQGLPTYSYGGIFG